MDALKTDLQGCLRWFSFNELVANPGKFKLMFLGKEMCNHIILNINGEKIYPSDCVKLLGVHIDKFLKFDHHIKTLCSSANKKIKCLYRIRRVLDEKQTLNLANAYVLSSFLYCPFIWMFCNKTLGSLINSVHKRLIRAVYGFNLLSLDVLLDHHNLISIHQKQLKLLMNEVYKSLNYMNPAFMKDFFLEKLMPYDLRDSDKLILPKTNSKRYGTSALHFQMCLLWNNLPLKVKRACSYNYNY